MPKTAINEPRDIVDIMYETPLNEAAIIDGANAVEREGSDAWAVIEPLAGMFWPRVEAAIKTEITRRAEAGESTATSPTSIPSALDALRAQLATPAELSDIECSLDGLLALGLSEFDLVVHIERLRATNDATAEDELTEENCLEALDLLYKKAAHDIGLGPSASSSTPAL